MKNLLSTAMTLLLLWQGQNGKSGEITQQEAKNDFKTTELESSPTPQAQRSLPRMMKIAWSSAPFFPQGMQDNDGGLIGSHLVMVGGFCHGIDNDWKPGKYPRGFLKKAWAMDVLHENEGWKELPDFPGSARQEMYGVSLNNELYLWGGFNYTDPYTYVDGYKLSKQANLWVWKKLVDLPRPYASGNAAIIGSKIYLFGGMDYDSERYYVVTDRSGKNNKYGSRLYAYDTKPDNLHWKELKGCPGTPRMMAGVAALNGKIYVIGGYSVDRGGTSHSVVDSWRYDPELDTWSRLRDLPVAVAGFGSGSIAYQNRYLLLPTGYPYPTILNPDETVRSSYGEPSKVDRSQWKQHPKLKGTTYSNHIWVYDTQKNLYGTATKLPYDDHGPAAHIIRDTVYMFPGETAGFWYKQEYFGHAPELVLKGKIQLLDWEQHNRQ